MKTWFFRLFSLLAGTLASLLIAEVVLRLHDPFGFRNRGDTIVLPRYKKYDFTTAIRGLPEVAHVRKNSLGFRGPEPPDESEEPLSIIAVGGSTTECLFLSEGADWPAVMATHLSHSFPNTWVNNAGIDGHSTRGHIALVEQAIQPLRPDIVVFYIGINETPGDLLTGSERNFIFDELRFVIGRDGIMSLIRYSHVLSAAYNLANMYYLKSITAEHDEVDVMALGVAEATEDARKQHLATVDALADGYTERIRTLVGMVRSWGGLPVLATQPLLLGPGIDPVTGVDLAKVSIDHLDGLTRWQRLERVNNITRAAARTLGAPLLDIATRLTRSSAYFYDLVHYTEAGAAALGELFAAELSLVIKRQN